MVDFLCLTKVEELPKSHKNGVIVIGNFDGVHRGHQSVLQHALDYAKKHQCPAIVYSFEPHPRSFFTPNRPVDRLTNAQQKVEIFKILGFNGVVLQAFDTEFSHLDANDFVNKIIINGFNARCIVTGFDFHFGKNRSGNPQFLQDAGKKMGFEVIQVPKFSDENGAVISSSRIRDLLIKGKVEEAAGLLGYRYRVNAEIIHGAKLGRTLGFPTANMSLPKQTGLAYGVYAVRFRRQNGVLYNGVASFGCRPTVTGNGEPLLETFVFSFDEELYGEIASVSFFSFLRGELKFEGLEPLVTQMNQDKNEAETLLSNINPLTNLDRKISF